MGFSDAFERMGQPKNAPKDIKQPQQQKPVEKQASPAKPKESKPNIGWLFYKDYFNGMNWEDIPSNTERIKNKVQHIIDQKVGTRGTKALGSHGFELVTTYPGLILGSGNAHELPDVKWQAILGFSFDYTSGLPVIAGSSIKGVLRNAFKSANGEYIKGLTQVEDIMSLEEEIFDNGDIFFDAEIIKPDSENKILGDDYLTPHDNPLKDPVPLRFIKVLPEVTFRFRFTLSDGIISATQKIELFQQIIIDQGVGAKTNVGYGKFTK